MPELPQFSYSLFLIIVSAIASLALFFRLAKNELLVVKEFLWHYAFGFAVLSLVNIPIFLINLGIQVDQTSLVILYTISFFALFFSYVLFYRGSVSLFTKEKFLTDIFPVIVFPVFALISVIAFFVFQIAHFIMYTAVVWGFLLPISGFLASLFFYFFLRGAPLDNTRGRLYSILLSFGWFFVLVVDFSLWLQVAPYPHAFWIVKLSGFTGWLLLRATAYIIIFIGALLYSRGIRRLKVPKTE